LTCNGHQNGCEESWQCLSFAAKARQHSVHSITPAVNAISPVANMNTLLFSQDSCINCKRMAAKMASMQSASQANEHMIKSLKEVIALHDKQPEDNSLQQRSTVDLLNNGSHPMRTSDSC